MEYSKKIDLIKDDQRYLIDYSNLKSGLIYNQKNFLNYNQLSKFCDNPKFGLPLILPFNNKYFDYHNSKNHFVLSKKKLDLNYLTLQNKIILVSNVFF